MKNRIQLNKMWRRTYGAVGLTVSIMTSQLMLLKQIIADYSDKHSKHIN